MLIDVEGDQRRRVPDRIRVLCVADIVEEAALVPVVGRPGPAAAGHPRGLQVGAPVLERAEVTLDQVADQAGRVASAEPRENLVSLVDVALVELVVSLDRCAGDAVELVELGLQLPGRDLLEPECERRHLSPLSSWLGARSISSVTKRARRSYQCPTRSRLFRTTMTR